LIAVGLAIVLNATGILDFGMIIGVFIGLLFLWWGYQSIRRSRKHSSDDGHFTVIGDNVVEDMSPHLDYSSVFGDTRVKATGKEFARGSIKNVFGDLVVDLSAIERITEPGTLYLDSVFGDVRVRLPADLAYSIDGRSVFGSTTAPEGTRRDGSRMRSENYDSTEGARRLRIHISHVFGDNEITR
jgi:predicted membrane protein